MDKFRIIIAGIGGVGGYIGGKLAKTYAGSAETEICFYSRGENLRIIQSNGITVQAADSTFTAKPDQCSNNANALGIADLIICSSKSYHLEQIMEELKPCIGPKTIILPLLNGVNAPETIRKTIPGAIVWDGCIYIVARLTSAGHVEQKGKVNALHFGSTPETIPQGNSILQLLRKAEIDAHLHEHIEQVVWEKFVFISAVASLTSYLNLGIGFILADPDHKKLLLQLINEVSSVAKAKNILLSSGLSDSIVARLASLPPETTSSMQVDFSEKKQTEVESLTGYVIREGKRLGVATPGYDTIYAAIR